MYQKINLEGEIIPMNFEFETETQVLGSCSATYMGQMYIFGGIAETKQISVISGCALKRLGNLGFDLETGTCGVYNFEVNDELILCFSGTDDKACQRFDGTDGQIITDGSQWKSITATRYHHRQSRLATYKGKPFIVGSRGNNDHKHTELLENGAWIKLRDYPYGSYLQGGISAYATASTATAAYIIGGKEHAIGVGDKPVKTFAKYENDVWTNIGGPNNGLSAARYGHNAIWLDDEVFIIGGHQTKNTEKWSQGLGLVALDHQMTDYEYYPELFIVPETFCSTN